MKNDQAGKFMPVTTGVRHIMLAGTGLLALAFAAQAQAQNASGQGQAQAEPQQAATAGSADDIIVMARRREERLQEVPVAVTAISGDDLARQSIVTLSDLTRAVPSLQIIPTAFGANVPRFVIRAQSQFEPLFTQDPSVAVYFADVVQARAHGINGAMYDLASVQVLKGPQGTLFGRNSTGGAVLIVPRAPTDTFEGYGTIEAGNYGLWSLEGAVNVPVSDALQIRLSGRRYAHNGYTKELQSGIGFDDADNWSLRLGVKARLGDRITNTLFLNNFKATENGTAMKLYNARPSLAINTLGALALKEFEESKSEGFHTVRTAFGKDSARTKTFGIENTTIFELADTVSIKNIFGYRNINSTVPFDFDGTRQLMYEGRITLDSKQYSNELQLVGTAFDKALDFIGGAYVFKESGTEIQATKLDYRPIFLQDVVGRGDITNKSQSVFAQGSYHIPQLQGLSLTAGLRYTWDQREMKRVGINNGKCAILSADIGGVPITPCERTGEYKHGALTYTLGADWQIDSSRLLYFVTRKGYRSGGINQRANLPSQFIPYQPETVTDYEIGLKADWNLQSAGNLRTNIAGYMQNYRDIQRTQTQTVGTPPNTTLITNVVNAAKAKVTGLEIDATWHPIPDISLRGYYSLANARYQKWNVPIVGGGVQDRSAYPFASVPRNSGGASAAFTYPLGIGIGKLTLSGDVYAQSQIQISDDNVLPEGINPGYTTFNARLEWSEVMGTRIDLAGWIRNIGNAQYYTSGVTGAGAGLGFTVKTIGAPQTFGLTARYDF